MVTPKYNFKQVLLRSFISLRDALRTSPVSDYFKDVANGLDSSVSRFSVEGIIPDISTADPLREVWAVSQKFVYKTVNATVSIASTSPNDTAGGTGAQEYTIVGVDEDFNEVTTIVASNGLTTVDITGYIFINKALVSKSGSVETNEGQIDFVHTGDIINRMLPLTGVTNTAIFYVPINKHILIYAAQGATIKNKGGVGEKEGIMYLQAKINGEAFVTKAPAGNRSDGAGIDFNITTPIRLEEKAIYRAVAESYSNSTSFTFVSEILIEENS